MANSCGKTCIARVSIRARQNVEALKSYKRRLSFSDKHVSQKISTFDCIASRVTSRWEAIRAIVLSLYELYMARRLFITLEHILLYVLSRNANEGMCFVPTYITTLSNFVSFLKPTTMLSYSRASYRPYRRAVSLIALTYTNLDHREHAYKKNRRGRLSYLLTESSWHL